MSDLSEIPFIKKDFRQNQKDFKNSNYKVLREILNSYRLNPNQESTNNYLS